MVLVNELYPSECISNRTTLDTSNPRFRMNGDPLLSVPNELSEKEDTTFSSPLVQDSSPIPAPNREPNEPKSVVAVELSFPRASTEDYGDDLTAVIKDVKETAPLVS